MQLPECIVGSPLDHQDIKRYKLIAVVLISATKPSFALMDGGNYTTEQGGNEWAYVGFLYRIGKLLQL